MPGYFTAATGTDAVNAGVLNQDQAAAGHSLAADYVLWQTGRNREQLGRDRLDLVLGIRCGARAVRAGAEPARIVRPVARGGGPVVEQSLGWQREPI
ncbi:hypothetical protein [Streptomyces sp. NPDC006334]|uniref:hypothetical protein n=1 Tax=Streptomyces sp. NPDC006334 TaxID=3156754 RepID=UPI0033A88814